jgi:hypothetical protein
VQLLTKEVLAKLPPLYSNEDKSADQVFAVVKFFTPWSHWTWFATEGSHVDADGYCDTDKPKVDFIFFGWVEGDFPELGTFSLSELQHIRGPLGLRVERDRYFIPKTLQALMDACEQRHGA